MFGGGGLKRPRHKLGCSATGKEEKNKTNSLFRGKDVFILFHFR
jgi:hypothetical protein